MKERKGWEGRSENSHQDALSQNPRSEAPIFFVFLKFFRRKKGQI